MVWYHYCSTYHIFFYRIVIVVVIVIIIIIHHHYFHHWWESPNKILDMYNYANFVDYKINKRPVGLGSSAINSNNNSQIALNFIWKQPICPLFNQYAGSSDISRLCGASYSPKSNNFWRIFQSTIIFEVSKWVIVFDQWSNTKILTLWQ